MSMIFLIPKESGIEDLHNFHWPNFRSIQNHPPNVFYDLLPEFYTFLQVKLQFFNIFSKLFFESSVPL